MEAIIRQHGFEHVRIDGALHVLIPFTLVGSNPIIGGVHFVRVNNMRELYEALGY